MLGTDAFLRLYAPNAYWETLFMEYAILESFVYCFLLSKIWNNDVTV